MGLAILITRGGVFGVLLTANMTAKTADDCGRGRAAVEAAGQPPSGDYALGRVTTNFVSTTEADG